MAQKDDKEKFEIEEKTTSDVMTESEIKENVRKLLMEKIDSSNLRTSKCLPRLLASQFMDAPPHDMILPHSYLLWEKGLFKADVGPDNSIVIKRLTQVPFFVAIKDEIGKVLLLRYLNRTWLSQWMPAKKMDSKSTYLNMLIFPENTVKFIELKNYAFQCAIEAPFVADPAIKKVMDVLRSKFGLDKLGNYPILVRVSEVKEICQEYEVSYNKFRKRLVSTGIIRDSSQIKRKNKKTARFLVFDRDI